jgi:hypothetical protein
MAYRFSQRLESNRALWGKSLAILEIAMKSSLARKAVWRGAQEANRDGKRAEIS